MPGSSAATKNQRISRFLIWPWRPRWSDGGVFGMHAVAEPEEVDGRQADDHDDDRSDLTKSKFGAFNPISSTSSVADAGMPRMIIGKEIALHRGVMAARRLACKSQAPQAVALRVRGLRGFFLR